MNKITREDIYYAAKIYEPIYREIYATIWSKFYRAILLRSKPLESFLGEVFADFRSLILAPQYDNEFDSTLMFQKPFWRASRGKEKTDEEIARRRGFEDVTSNYDSNDILNRFWRFLTINIDGISLLDYEFTISQLLNKRALYASNLGSQPPERTSQSRLPVRYLLFTNTNNGWQIGRLVDQLHHLGTVRLAAVIEFEKLRTAAYQLRAVDEIMQGLLGNRQNKSSIGIPNPSATSISATKTWIEQRQKELRKLRGEIKLINEEIENINGRLSGGLEYRIERSRYYVRQFANGVEALRVKRIEGFQPYDVFVRRRLGTAFDFIESLHSQVGRIFGQRTSLVRQLQSLDDEVIAAETSLRSLEIMKIQEVGDLALWVVLAPYYVGSIIVKDIIRWDEKLVFTSIAWVSIWSAFAVLNSFLSLRRDRANKRPHAFSYFIGRNICFIALASIVVFLLSWLGTDHVSETNSGAKMAPTIQKYNITLRIDQRQTLPQPQSGKFQIQKTNTPP